jgi:ATP-dependent RNA helicase DHX40
LKHLFFLEAVDKSGRITYIGEELSKFPLSPAYAKTLLYGFFLQEYVNRKSKVVGDLLKLVSVLSTENIWMNVSKADQRGQESLAAVKRRFRDTEGDHFGLVEVFDAWYAEK